MLILDNEYHVVASQSKNITEMEMMVKEISDGIEKNKASDGHFIKAINNERFAVNFIRSDYNEWVYVSILSLKEITRDSRNIAWIAIFGCGFIILLTGFASVFATKRIYVPIKNIYSYIEGIYGKGDLARNRDEMKYIKDGISSLVEAKGQMAEKINVQIEQLKEFFVMKLFDRDLQNNDMNKNIVLFEGATWEWLCIVAIEVDSFDESHFNEKDRNLIMFTVNNIVNEIIPPEIEYFPF